MTLRLYPNERQLVQDLGRGPEPASDRHHALLDLVPIVEELDLPDIRERARQPIRLGIPDELDAAIRAVMENTGQTYIDVLLVAATEYRKRYPLSPSA